MTPPNSKVILVISVLLLVMCILVHRRTLECTCYRRAEKNMNEGQGTNCSIDQMKAPCDYVYSNFTKQNNLTIVLKRLNTTTPCLYEMNTYWLMVLSKTHYGNPISTVDLLERMETVSRQESRGAIFLLSKLVTTT